MKTLTINYNKGNVITYKLMEDGQNLPIAYHEETSKEVIHALEFARKNRIRVKLYYGDVKTGRDWCEENDTIGYIGLSRGTDARYPILVYNNRSYGGGAILDHCILKIRETKGGRVIYQAQNYNAPEVQIQHSDLAGYAYNTIVNGNLYGRHKTLKSAELLKNKLL